MAINGKGNKSYKKRDLQNQKSIALGFKNLTFAYKASGGETFIDLTNLTTPSELSSKGFVNPSATELLSAQLLIYKDNLILYRSVGGALIPFDGYQIITSSKINLTVAAQVNEIFYGQIISSPQAGILGVDARVIHSTGVLLANETDINVGQEFVINAYSDSQIGEVMLIVDGEAQMRNVGNATAAPAADGNYEEVPVSGGLGSILRMNASVGYNRAYIAVSTVAIVQRPDGSRDSALESLAGQVDKLIPTVAQLAGVPETDFQSAPNDVNLKQFGEDVLDLIRRVSALENASVGSFEQSMLTELQFQTENGTDWVLSDGRDVTGSRYHSITGSSTAPDCRGLFLRAAGTHGSLQDAAGNNYSGPAVGSSENDQFQGHYHGSPLDFSDGASESVRAGGTPEGTLYTGSPTTDGSNGTPRTGAETQPANMGVNVFIKIN